MKLKIKGKEKEKIIELEQGQEYVYVRIEGELIAKFSNDGDFKFFGQNNESQYEGK